MKTLLYRGDEFDPNFYYFAKVDIDHCFLLLDEATNARQLFVPKMNERIARRTFEGKVIVYGKILDILAKQLKGKKVQADLSALSANMAMRLGKFCTLVDHSEELLKKRSSKNELEVKNTQKAVKITKEIFESLDFKSAKTEGDIVKQLKVATIERGLEQAFEPIVATDANSAYPHYKCDDNGRKLGSLLLVDYGVRYDHYCADLTRCFILDGDKKKLQEYERLKGVAFDIIDRMNDMTCGKDVASLTDKLMKKAKFPQMIHSIGHGVGLEIHEFPRLGISSVDKLRKVTLAIEPAFYLKKYGMRYEETIYFDSKKARIL